jgi:uncharacterized DUF497 family protein
MQFEWDDAKHRLNVSVRGIGFDDGALVFGGPVIEWIDLRIAYGEVRVRAVGLSGDDLLHVVYTDRDDVRRIISVRRANRKERAAWLRRA